MNFDPQAEAVDFDRALHVHASRDYSTAIHLWRRHLTTYGWQRSAGFNLAIAEMHAGDSEQALQLMERVIAERADAAAFHIRSGIFRALGRLEEAYGEIHRAINLDNNALVRVGLAEILLDMGKTEQAEKEFRRAHKMANDIHQQGSAVAGLAPMLLAEQRWDEAVELLVPIAQAQTGEAHESQFQLGRAHYLKWFLGGRDADSPLLEEALRWFEAAQESGPRDPRPWTAIGLVQLGQMKWQAGRESLRRGLELGDQVHFVNVNLSEACLMTEDYEAALEHALVAVEGEFTRGEAWECVAIAAGHLDMGRTGSLIRQAVSELPESAKTANALGALLVYEESPDIAEHWVAAMTQWPTDPVILTNAVVFLMGEGQFGHARAALESLEVLDGLGDKKPHSPSVKMDGALRDALLRGDEDEVSRLLESGAEVHAVQGDHLMTMITAPLEDYYLQLNATRFEERLGVARSSKWKVRTGTRPTYLEGKEIDVECSRDGELELVEAKFRLNDQPVTRSEVIILSRKVATARKNLADVRVVGTLSSNASTVDDDAWDAAVEHGIRLERCSVPRNWFRNPRWDIVRIEEYPRPEREALGLEPEPPSGTVH